MNDIPAHIAIIMDGNGRWAMKHGLARIEGHRRGVLASENIVEHCRELGVKYLTLYAFSDENWQRPEAEVDGLMELLAAFLSAKCEKMVKNGVRLRTIGDIEKLPEEVRREIARVKKETENGQHLDLILSLSYGSHQEIVRAFNRLIKAGKRVATIEDIEACLDTAGIPHPDLLIRTSGELRISNFLLWQSAYAEFYFTDVLWPDFGVGDLMEAIEDYRRRERRFGRVAGEG